MALPIKLGDKITLKNGRTIVAVDKWQKAQTVTYWINGLSEGQLIQYDLEGDLDMWDIKTHWPKPMPRGYLAACYQEEMDIEENEWGKVMP